MNDVRARRVALGLTQEELATACRVSRLTILSLELGRTDPALSLALRVAARLGTTVDALFNAPGAADEHYPEATAP